MAKSKFSFQDGGSVTIDLTGSYKGKVSAPCQFYNM
jgi:hypothetical protein